MGICSGRTPNFQIMNSPFDGNTCFTRVTSTVEWGPTV